MPGLVGLGALLLVKTWNCWSSAALLGRARQRQDQCGFAPIPHVTDKSLRRRNAAPASSGVFMGTQPQIRLAIGCLPAEQG